MNHDQNFKNLILDYPREALAFFAAEESAGVDASARIIPIREEQLKERLGERFRELDVPLLVEWSDGRREAILFVLEEETDPARFSIHRLAHYCLDLAELFETERVVPVVIFLRGDIPQRELILGGDRHDYLTFRYLHCALATLPFDQHRDSDNLVVRLNLPNMRYAPGRRIEVYAQAVRGLADLEADPEKRLKYLDYIDIYTNLSDTERERYEREYPTEAEIMMTFTERVRQQSEQIGEQRGELRGERRGEQKGEARLLLRLVGLKYGEVPDDTRRRIEAADAETLLIWSDRILTAECIDDIFR